MTEQRLGSTVARRRLVQRLQPALNHRISDADVHRRLDEHRRTSTDDGLAHVTRVRTTAAV